MIPGFVDNGARIVQLALTPVFLLTGIATLLNVLALRLGRVADKAEQLVAAPNSYHARQAESLRWRTGCLDCAVLAAAFGGFLTCGAVLALFFAELRGENNQAVLFLMFGGAIFMTMVALSAFVAEMLVATSGARSLLVERKEQR